MAAGGAHAANLADAARAQLADVRVGDVRATPPACRACRPCWARGSRPGCAPRRGRCAGRSAVASISVAPDAHGHAANNLGVGRLGVHQPAHVVDPAQAGHANGAAGLVHPHLGKHGPEGVERILLPAPRPAWPHPWPRRKAAWPGAEWRRTPPLWPGWLSAPTVPPALQWRRPPRQTAATARRRQPGF